MKRFYLFLMLLSIPIVLFTGCFGGDDNDENTDYGDVNFRQEMRDFVIGISDYSKAISSNFIVIPQNGQELITSNGEPDGIIQTDYLAAIDGTGREDLFFGYDNDNEQTPAEESEYMLDYCQLFEQNEVKVLTTDYCSAQSKIDSSYAWNKAYDFISFAATERDLNVIPDYPAVPYNVNTDDISTLTDAQNFLYLINSENFTDKQDFISAVAATNYDVIIMDLYHNEDSYTSTEIEQLKTKQNGGTRLVICYMSIGEAEDYRYYWQSDWSVGNPDWLTEENPDWEGNFKVMYWEQDWQDIIYGNDSSYLKKILDAGFDGVYLDIIDAFEYFE